MYERSDAVYLEMLFSSEGLGDFLNKSQYIEKISEYDHKMLEEYKETREEIEITKEKLDILREADAIFREEIAKAKLEMQMNQYFAVLTNMKSVGVMGDGRTYDWAVALRSVTTEDFMTADWSRIPYEVLDKVSGRIVNEVSHVNRVLYDITSKPPATVEFE